MGSITDNLLLLLLTVSITLIIIYYYYQDIYYYYWGITNIAECQLSIFYGLVNGIKILCVSNKTFYLIKSSTAKYMIKWQWM